MPRELDAVWEYLKKRLAPNGSFCFACSYCGQNFSTQNATRAKKTCSQMFSCTSRSEEKCTDIVQQQSYASNGHNNNNLRQHFQDRCYAFKQNLKCQTLLKYSYI